jgi:hypothetical protein
MPSQRSFRPAHTAEQNIAVGEFQKEEIVARMNFVPRTHRAGNNELALAGNRRCHGVRMSYPEIRSSRLSGRNVTALQTKLTTKGH